MAYAREYGVPYGFDDRILGCEVTQGDKTARCEGLANRYFVGRIVLNIRDELPDDDSRRTYRHHMASVTKLDAEMNKISNRSLSSRADCKVTGVDW